MDGDSGKPWCWGGERWGNRLSRSDVGPLDGQHPPRPIPVSETPDVGSRPSQGLGHQGPLSGSVTATQTKLESSPPGAYLCFHLGQLPLW